LPDPDDQTLLLIDADDAVRDSIKVLLESHGFAVRDFRSPDEFLAATSPHGQCLILGLNRNTADGINLIRKLRHHGLDLPVILVAAARSAMATAASSAAGAFACLERPVPEAMLLQTIRAALAKPATTCSTREPASKAPPDGD
jgi:FixJ family two-component response regulator